MSIYSLFRALVILLASISLAPPFAPLKQANGQGLLESSSSLDFQGLTKVQRSRVVAGQMCVLKGRVSNSGEETEQAALVATVNGQFDLITARAIEVEPGRTEDYEISIRIPERLPGKRVKIEVALKRKESGGEVLLARNGSPIVSSIELPLEERPFTTSQVLAPDPSQYPDWFWPPVEVKLRSDYELSVGSQVEAGLERYSVSFEKEGVPLDFAEWEGVDLLIVSDDHILQDEASARSVKRFLDTGGRVWVMLDRVPVAQLSSLLNDDQVIEVIDNVQLYKVVMDLPKKGLNFREEDRTVESDEPLLLKRVVQYGGETTHSANGWPASITFRVGYGELIVTTLDCSAWMQRRSKPYSSEPLKNSGFEPLLWSRPLVSDQMFSALPEKPTVKESDYAMQFLGVPIVPKSWVAIALIVFCASLGGLAIWRASAGDLARIGALTPALAICLSCGLLASKRFINSGIEPAAAKLQLVEVNQDGNSAEVTELAACYTPDGGEMELSFTNDGIAIPVDSLGTGIHRAETTDFQTWKLSNDSWPVGLWRYQDRYHLELDEQVVTIELDEQGCNLSFPGGIASSMQDAVLAYAPGHPMLCTPSDEGMSADGSTRIGTKKWLASTLLSDEQKRRSAVYAELLEMEYDGFAPRKVIYGWTDLWDGPQWEKLPDKGSALVRMPVEVKRPPVGKKVLVPYGLISLRQDAEQLGISSSLDERTGKWRPGQTSAMDRRLQFVLPQSLVPFKADGIDLNLNIKAPHRIVTISAATKSGERELAVLNSPSIPWQYSIEDKDILAECRDGIIDIRVQISDRTDGGSGGQSVVRWNIDFFDAVAVGSVDDD